MAVDSGERRRHVSVAARTFVARVFWEGVKAVRGEGPLEESEEEGAREGRRGWGRHPRVEVRERSTSAVSIPTRVWLC